MELAIHETWAPGSTRVLKVTQFMSMETYPVLVHNLY